MLAVNSAGQQNTRPASPLESECSFWASKGITAYFSFKTTGEGIFSTVAAKAESFWKSIKRAQRSALRQPTTPPRSCIAGQWGVKGCDRIRKVIGRRGAVPGARPPPALPGSWPSGSQCRPPSKTVEASAQSVGGRLRFHGSEQLGAQSPGCPRAAGSQPAASSPGLRAQLDRSSATGPGCVM